MKLNKILENKEEEKKFTYEKKNSNSFVFELENKNIEKFQRYNNCSVILMKKNCKGNLRSLSKLVNDGKYPSSWCIRVHYIKEEWSINVVPHDSFNKQNNTVNIMNSLSSIYEKKNLKYNGYDTFLNINEIKTKDHVEKIVKEIIEKLEDVKLEIDHPVLFLDYKLEKDSLEFRIKSTFIEEEKMSESLYKKYLKIIAILSKVPLLEEEREELEKIGIKLIDEKKISEEEKDEIDELSEKYISQNKRISLSLSSLMEEI